MDVWGLLGYLASLGYASLSSRADILVSLVLKNGRVAIITRGRYAGKKVRRSRYLNF